jgi:hypothetical protein
MAHIDQHRTLKFQPQLILKSRVASGRPVCYLILRVQLSGRTADIYFCSKACPGLKLKDHMPHINQRRTLKFQPLLMLESSDKFGRPVC